MPVAKVCSPGRPPSAAAFPRRSGSTVSRWPSRLARPGSSWLSGWPRPIQTSGPSESSWLPPMATMPSLRTRGLLFCKVGEALVGGVRGPGCCYSTGERSKGMAGEGTTMGSRKEATHRGGHRPTEGPLCPGAPSREDSWRVAHSSAGEGRRLHLWAGAQQAARTPTSPSGEPFDLSNYATNV